MPNEKEMEDVSIPIWQNHEQRITALEINMTGLSDKMDKVDATIKEGNKEQKDMLTMINNRMVDEFFGRKRLNFSNWWKLLFTLLGGGSIIYVLIDKFL